jgi:hypothetical protein
LTLHFEGIPQVRVKDLYAILKREPDRWNMDLIVEVESSTGTVIADLEGLTTTLDDPRQAILRVKVRTHERQEEPDPSGE